MFRICISALTFTALMASCQPTTQIDMSSSTPPEDSTWRDRLTEAQYRVLRQGGTEAPFSSPLNEEFNEGEYHCAGCGALLYVSDHKFDGHCGWPSFDAASGNIKYVEDHSHGMHRIEIRCASCDGHLGHVFNDGPTETGMRHCVNGLSLNFEPSQSHDDSKNSIEQDSIK